MLTPLKCRMDSEYDAFILKDVSARAALAMDNISQEMSRNP